MKVATRLLRRRRDDERGATLILTAICMVALLGTSAMAVDLGFTVYGSREAQAMADTAALDIVQNISTADSQSTYGAVQSYISGLLAGVKTDNGSNAGLTATPGWYSGGTFTAQTAAASCANTVFSTLPPPCNAVRVSASQVVPQIFWGGFNTLVAHGGGGSGGSGGDCTAANACTTTAWTPESGFSIGSYLLSINTQQTAVLNVLLGKLGTSATVTFLGYQGLANTYVSVNQLIAASGGLLTTSNVMTTSLTGAQWLGIWQTAVANQVGASTDARAALNGLSFSGSTSAELCQMVSISGSTCANGSLKTSALSASLDALQMLTTEAELANGGNSALNVGTALNIPGVSAATLTLTLVQPPQLSNPYPGPVGSYISSAQCPAPSGQTSTCATTAQLTSDIKLTLVGGVLDIPLSAAEGVATLSQVNCVNNVMSSVKINVGTAAVTGAVTLANAPVANLTIAAVSNRAGTYTIVPPNSTSESATPESNPQNFGSNNGTWSYSGLTLGALDPTSILLKSTLPPVLGPVLQSLGVTVGGAQVADLTARCDVVSIVG